MLDDAKLDLALTEVLATARSGATVDELIALFTSHAVALVPVNRVEVRPLAPRDGAREDDAGASPDPHVARFPVPCGRGAWGELHLGRLDGPLSDGDLRRGRLLAEVLGAALTTSRSNVSLREPLERHAPSVRPTAGHPSPDDVVAVVMACAEDLDRMPDAPTRARLALVAGRLATAIGAPRWSVALAHRGQLHDLSEGATSTTLSAPDTQAAPGAPVRLSRFPALRRASEGSAFYADHSCGEPAERRLVAAGGYSAVIGAGGYDPEGRSWVVQVFAASGDGVAHLTPVLAAVVQAALSFPRGATVPPAEDPRVRAILKGPSHAGSASEGRTLSETG